MSGHTTQQEYGEKDAVLSDLVQELSEVLKGLPTNKLEELATELTKTFDVYSIGDLVYVELENLKKNIQTLGIAQKTKLLEYVSQAQQDKRQRQIAQSTPRHEVSAFFSRNHTDKPSDIKVASGGKIRVHAKNTAAKTSGNTKTEAVFSEGLSNVKIEDGASTEISAGGSGLPDKEKIAFIARLQQVLTTLPHKKTIELVEELEETFGIYAESDLKGADLNKLKSLKGVQLSKFLTYAQSL